MNVKNGFTDKSHPGADQAVSVEEALSENRLLEQELAANREHLDAILKARELFSRRLQLANEQLVNTNEEWQTATEELRAANTELARLNQELRERNDDLNNLLDSVNMPIVMLGKDLCIRQFTPKAEELFHLIPGDVGRPFSHMRPTLELPDLGPLILEVIDTLVAKELEVQDGQGRWYAVRIRPYKIQGNLVEGAVIASVNITERKRAEEALRESEQRAYRELAELEQLYKTSPIGLCFVSTDLRYVRVNERLAAIHGVAAREHLGRHIRDITPHLAESVEPLFHEVISSGQPIVEREIHGLTPAEPNVGRDFLVSYYPVTGGDGEVLGVSSVVQDITERKRFEGQLRHRQKLEGLGVLAGGVAHDFNNLLTGILGNASLALNNLSRSNSARARVEEVIQASQRAAELTGQLLGYSGKGRFHIQPVDLPEVVRGISKLVRTSIPKNVQLRLELARHLPPVEADASQIQQLVVNLVINGAEAIGENSGAVLVTTGTQLVGQHDLRETFAAEGIAPGPYVSLEVCDTGCGMTQETRSKIFDPFFTTKQTGRGLGLAAVLGIVHGDKGAIQVYTAQPQGPLLEYCWLPTRASKCG
jgi:PAS domain S-box-containing protein